MFNVRNSMTPTHKYSNLLPKYQCIEIRLRDLHLSYHYVIIITKSLVQEIYPHMIWLIHTLQENH